MSIKLGTMNTVDLKQPDNCRFLSGKMSLVKLECRMLNFNDPYWIRMAHANLWEHMLN